MADKSWRDSYWTSDEALAKSLASDELDYMNWMIPPYMSTDNDLGFATSSFSRRSSRSSSGGGHHRRTSSRSSSGGGSRGSRGSRRSYSSQLPGFYGVKSRSGSRSSSGGDVGNQSFHEIPYAYPIEMSFSPQPSPRPSRYAVESSSPRRPSPPPPSPPRSTVEPPAPLYPPFYPPFYPPIYPAFVYGQNASIPTATVTKQIRPNRPLPQRPQLPKGATRTASIEARLRMRESPFREPSYPTWLSTGKTRTRNPSFKFSQAREGYEFPPRRRPNPTPRPRIVVPPSPPPQQDLDMTPPSSPREGQMLERHKATVLKDAIAHIGPDGHLYWVSPKQYNALLRLEASRYKRRTLTFKPPNPTRTEAAQRRTRKSGRFVKEH